MMDIYLQNKYILTINNSNTKVEIHKLIEEKLNSKDFYIIHNGKILNDETIIPKNGVFHVIPRTLGGKGGFGSMLRAIGAQIEKTTNREACRDLSGRRLRDINEEKRLKNWIDQQAAREQDIALRKEEKIKRLSHKPKHEFKDDNYDKERSEMPERVDDAVSQGLSAVAGSSGVKRKLETDTQKNKKKKALWIDDGIDEDDLSSSNSESEEEKPKEEKPEEVAEREIKEDESELVGKSLNP